MLAQILKLRTRIAALVLLAGVSSMVSCTTPRDQVKLVKDPDEKAESMLPWNRQEKWETQGQFSGMTDRR